MAWSTAICQICCTPPQVAANASQVLENNRNLSQYVYVSTIQAARPNKPYQYKSQTERLQTLMGKLSNPQAVALRSNGGVPCPCITVGAISGVSTSFIEVDGIFTFTVVWDAVPGAASYTVTTTYPDASEITIVGTSASFTSTTIDPNYSITITASNGCSSTTSTTNFDNGPCFLAGSLVTMADGSEKRIEEVQIGDSILGAFGEYNTVLALHRPLLGDTLMCRINTDHSTTNHHPHVSIDKKFYSNDPLAVDEKTYGREHEVIGIDGTKQMRMLHGLKKGRVQQLELGSILKVVSGGCIVESIEPYSMPPETQLYNLVVGGSHTYHVDGYAVTGWPREDDFDYDLWIPRS